MAITAVLLIIISKERDKFYLDRLLVVMLILVAWCTVSAQTAIVPSDENTDLWLKLTKEVVLAVMITGVAATRYRIHMVCAVLAIALGFFGAFEGLLSILTVGGHKILGSPGIGDNNSLALALLMAAPITYYVGRYSAIRAVRVAMYTVLALDTVTVVMTFSRGGFVGLIVVAAMVIKNSKNKLVSLFLVSISGILIYTLAPSAWFDRLNTLNEVDTDGSFLGRVVAWKISTLIALDNPLFGGGMHAVQRWPVWLRFKPYLARVDFLTTPPVGEMAPKAAHSIYFEVLGDMGFAGLFLFLLMLGIGFFYCSKIIRLSRPHPELMWAADLARMIQISMAVYFVSGAALSMAYFEMLYVLLAVVSRTRRLVLQAVREKNQGTLASARDGPVPLALAGGRAFAGGASAAYRQGPPRPTASLVAEPGSGGSFVQARRRDL